LALLIPHKKQLGALKSQLEYIEIDEIIRSKGMHEYLDDIQRKLNNISSAIYNSFFVVQDNYSEVKYDTNYSEVK
jgi:uncharacterized alpha-E superfamily protein